MNIITANNISIINNITALAVAKRTTVHALTSYSASKNQFIVAVTPIHPNDSNGSYDFLMNRFVDLNESNATETLNNIKYEFVELLNRLNIKNATTEASA